MKTLTINETVDTGSTLASLLDELEGICLHTVSLIETLKAKDLAEAQREDILGELSVLLSHLKIHSGEVENIIDETESE